MACTIVVLLSWCKPFRLWELPAEKHGHQPLKCFNPMLPWFPRRVHGQVCSPMSMVRMGMLADRRNPEWNLPHVRTVQEKLIGDVMAFAGLRAMAIASASPAWVWLQAVFRTRPPLRTGMLVGSFLPGLRFYLFKRFNNCYILLLNSL